jgi:multiple sugar transport system substrate-binding protein
VTHTIRRSLGAAGAIVIAGSALAPTAGLAQDASPAWSQDFAGSTLNVIAEATLNTQILEELLPDFTAKTGINVTIEQAPYDNLVQKVTLDASTSQGQYDVVSLPYEFLGSFATNGWITPLDDRFADSASFEPGFDPSGIIPALQTASAVWDGATYGAPSNSAVMMMFYRKDLFEDPTEQAAFKERYGYDLAVPTTWAQYRDAAEFFTRKAGDLAAGQPLAADLAGVAMTGKRHVATVLEWMDYGWTFGGGILDDAGNLVIDSQPSIDSLQYMVDLTQFAQPGYTSATWDETTAALQQGLAALSITWGDTEGAREAADQSAVAGKMGYASIPVLNEGDTNIAHLGSWTYTVPTAGAQQDAAWQFLQWALSTDVQTELAKRGGLPALTSAFQDPELVASLPYWTQELTSLSEAKSRPRIPEWGAMSDILQQHISDAISGQAAPADALAAAKTELEGILTLPVTQQ